MFRIRVASLKKHLQAAKQKQKTRQSGVLVDFRVLIGEPKRLPLPPKRPEKQSVLEQEVACLRSLLSAAAPTLSVDVESRLAS